MSCGSAETSVEKVMAKILKPGSAVPRECGRTIFVRPQELGMCGRTIFVRTAHWKFRGCTIYPRFRLLFHFWTLGARFETIVCGFFKKFIGVSDSNSDLVNIHEYITDFII